MFLANFIAAILVSASVKKEGKIEKVKMEPIDHRNVLAASGKSFQTHVVIHYVGVFKICQGKVHTVQFLWFSPHICCGKQV